MVQELVITSTFLILLATPKTARCCLHCEKNFTTKFSYYRRHLWGRSTWAGDLIYCQNFIDSWVHEIKESKIAIPKVDLRLIAEDVYLQMDQQYKLSHTAIGYFPKALQRIKRSEDENMNEALKNSFRICSEHCGSHKIDYIDCTNCETKPVQCGRKCPEIEHRGILNSVNTTTQPQNQLTAKTVAIILLPIFIAIILLFTAFGCLIYCKKRRKKKVSKQKRKGSKPREQDLARTGSHKSRRWKKRKRKVKPEISSSTK